MPNLVKSGSPGGSWLARKLGLSERDQAKLQRSIGPLKDVGDFFADAARTLKASGALEAIANALPWAGALGHGAAVTVAPIAFLAKLLSKLTAEIDPDGLAYLACTTAYERSVEQATVAIGPPKGATKDDTRVVRKDMANAFDALKPSAEFDFSTLGLDRAVEHPFVIEADQWLVVFAEAAGYDEVERRRLVIEVHSRFVVNLKTLLSHGQLRQRFAPLTERLRLGTSEALAYDALYEHADLQRRQFEELPALGTEAFPLSDVYVDLDCGKLAWGDIRDAEAAATPRGTERERAAIDPFDEASGGRHGLIGTVMELVGDPSFKDAIVIQGVAGAGKSAFTLRLCAELIHEGLRPVRVRMRDLQFDRHAGEAIRQAVKLASEAAPSRYARAPDDLFLGGAIWNEQVTFRGARICPYVLILDGWDEISVSVTEGFRTRLDRMLEQVRSEYLSNREVPVRVVLTGRPSIALTEASFLRDRTMVLTMRPFRPEQLDQFIKMLASALKKTNEAADDAQRWEIPDPKRFRPVQQQYRRDFKLVVDGAEGDGAAPRGSMEVLGLPLLAHIALRLMSSYQGELVELVRSPTTLYRNLVDLTCERAGQVGRQALDPAARPRVTGATLRALLRRTAAAITAQGDEAISYGELQRRLRLDPRELDARAEQANADMLTALMVSFYFKGGHRELGCEFVHKSFREYLFAEAIVEALKEYGRRAIDAPAPRRPYWKDFIDAERFDWSRALGELCAPQWLALDVVGHVEQLVAWEIARADRAREAGPKRSTEALSLDAWCAVRDGLADLWDWWAEGVHLRPQPKQTERGGITLAGTYADKLVDWSAPQAVEWGDAKLAPARTLTMDAHLGDALFRLSALVHFHVARVQGWLDRAKTPEALWSGASEPGKNVRRYQAEIGGARVVVFSPSGENADYFANYVMRINAAGWRPGGAFPHGVDMRGVDLRGATFLVPNPQTPPRRSLLRHANLSGATLIGSCLFGAVLADALLAEAILDRTELASAELNNACLRDATLVRADLRGADLRGANLRGADLTGASLRGARVAGCDLEGAELRLVDDREVDPPRAPTV